MKAREPQNCGKRGKFLQVISLGPCLALYANNMHVLDHTPGLLYLYSADLTFAEGRNYLKELGHSRTLGGGPCNGILGP